MKLNKIERLKNNLKPIEYFNKLKSLDFANLSEDDRFYLKNFGIYTQSQRVDEFMLRLRIAGGRIKISELKEIISIAKNFNAEIILTARSQIELQKLTPKNILNAFLILEQKRLCSWQSLTDNLRNIVTDIFDGATVFSKIETYPLIIQMQNLFLKNGEFVGMLPRKFNTAISGVEANSTSLFGNDCYFTLAIKDGKYGFNLYLGGKNSEVAKSANIFIEANEVIELFSAVIKTYMKYGNRGSRTKARLYFLLQEIGIDGFKERMQEFYKKDYKSAGETILKEFKSSKDRFYELKNGTFAYKYITNLGQIKLLELEKIFTYCKENSLKIRLGIDQNIYIFGLKQREFPFKSNSKYENLLVCAGSKYCFFSLFDTKSEAEHLKLDKIRKYGIKVGYSGCLKGCGRHYFSDIGFVGIRTNLYGTKEFAVRLYLGGLYSGGKSGARLIFWAIPLRILNSVIEVIIKEFEHSGYKKFESFSKNILNNFESEFLAFWFLAKLYTKKEVFLDMPHSFDYLIDENNKNRLYEAIKLLEKSVFNLL